MVSYTNTSVGGRYMYMYMYTPNNIIPVHVHLHIHSYMLLHLVYMKSKMSTVTNSKISVYYSCRTIASLCECCVPVDITIFSAQKY